MFFFTCEKIPTVLARNNVQFCFRKTASKPSYSIHNNIAKGLATRLLFPASSFYMTESHSEEG